jgi:hypothetical protein
MVHTPHSPCIGPTLLELLRIHLFKEMRKIMLDANIGFNRPSRDKTSLIFMNKALDHFEQPLHEDPGQQFSVTVE